MTFGLGPAPKIFTKLLKVPVSLLRRLKIRIVIYIDDMLVMAASLEEITMALDTVVYLLQALGFTLNEKKSMLKPCQVMEFLGVTVNSLDMTFTIPEEKVSELIETCQTSLNQGKMSLRQLMRVIGKLGATASAFSQARLQVRYLQNDLIASQRKGKSMFQNIKLSEKAKLELHWWIENIKIQNGRPMTLREPEMIIYSDAASSWGWGAECQGQKTGGQWKKEEADLHINILELLAAKFALKSFLSLRTVKSVH